MTSNKICNAIEAFGLEHQLDILTEEAGELVQIVSKIKRAERNADFTGKSRAELYDNLAEEVADIYIAIENIQPVIPLSQISAHYTRKKERLTQRIQTYLRRKIYK